MTLATATATATPRSTVRSIVAVVGGLFATFAVTTATDLAMHAFGVFPPFGERMSDGLFVVALAYRLVFNVGGAYVAARLAPTRPMRHALVLGAIGTVLATLGALAMGKYGPAWYSVANIVVAFPCVAAGAYLYERSLRTGAARGDG